MISKSSRSYDSIRTRTACLEQLQIISTAGSLQQKEQGANIYLNSFLVRKTSDIPELHGLVFGVGNKKSGISLATRKNTTKIHYNKITSLYKNIIRIEIAQHLKQCFKSVIPFPRPSVLTFVSMYVIPSQCPAIIPTGTGLSSLKVLLSHTLQKMYFTINIFW